MSGIMNKLLHKQHTTPATGAPLTQQPHLMQQQQAGFIQPGITQQSSIVQQPGLLQEQPLQTTHVAAPIVQETIRNDTVVEVQPIIHREVDKNVVHHIEKHIQEAHAPNMGGVVERPAIVQQEIHTNVINEIQPVIHRERVVPVVERAEEHLTQRIVEPTIHTHEVIYENSSTPLYSSQQAGLLSSQSSSMLPGQNILPSHSSSYPLQQQPQLPFQHGVPLPSQSSSFPLQQQQQLPGQNMLSSQSSSMLPNQNMLPSQSSSFPLQQQQQLPLPQQQGVGAMAAGLAANSLLNKQQNPPLSQQPLAQNLAQNLAHQPPLSQQQQNPLLPQQQGVGAMAANALLNNNQQSQHQYPLSQIQQTLSQPIGQNQQNFSHPLSQQPLSSQQPSLGQGIVKGVENEVLNAMGTKSNTPLAPASNQQAYRQGF